MGNIQKEQDTTPIHSESVDSLLSPLSKNTSNNVSSALEWRTVFPTLSTEEEVNALQHGKIPAEVIYSWDAGRKLSAIDHQAMHVYTLMVNNGISNMFNSLWSDTKHSAKKFRNCLAHFNTWVDIWTGNGVVSNMVAFPLFNQATAARFERTIEALQSWNTDILHQGAAGKPRFISCDLSQASLSLAESRAKDRFHDLEKLFELEYYPGKFQSLLADKDDRNTSPRLITMFNVLANFEYEELQSLLRDIANSMQSWDIFIPSFFAMHDKDKDMHLQDLTFSELTKELYANKETKDRCISAFSDRYKTNPSSIVYHVDRKNNGRDFIDVSLSVPEGTSLHVPTTSWEDLQVTPTNKTFEVFKSYRMSKETIEELCKTAWFEIDYRLEDRESIHLAPVLYKP